MHLAESRKTEISRLESGIASLQQSLDSANVQLAAFQGQDPHAMDSLRVEYESLRKQNEACADRISTLQKNLAGWENERRKFKEVMAVCWHLHSLCDQGEEKERSKAQSDYIKRQESDISRVRRERDTAQANLALEKNKSAIEFNQIKELRMLANSRQDRIKALESQVERFKISIAEGKGYKELLDYFGEEEASGEANPFKALRAKLSVVETELQASKKAMDALDTDMREKAEVLPLQSPSKLLF